MARECRSPERSCSLSQFTTFDNTHTKVWLIESYW